MGCILILVILGAPRIALVLLWLIRPGYLSDAYGMVVWPLLGFLFFPFTTLAFAYSMNSLGHGAMTPLGWVLTLIGLLLDVGSGGGAARARRRRD
jgi:hypothetical protein